MCVHVHHVIQNATKHTTKSDHLGNTYKIEANTCVCDKNKHCTTHPKHIPACVHIPMTKKQTCEQLAMCVHMQNIAPNMKHTFHIVYCMLPSIGVNCMLPVEYEFEYYIYICIYVYMYICIYIYILAGL